MESTNKKRTAVAAVATAAALVLTVTFAWVMENDQTELNKFTAKDPGTYKVELKEDFDPNDPWANKDVWVENKGDNPVIVRVRLEEFYDLEYRNGTTYNIKKGLANGDPDGKAIFKVPGGSELADNLTADSSTGIDKNVILKFGENGTGVTTMEKWNAMEADAKAAVNWVIDKDGWCYYTKALLYGEKTSYLLDDVDFNEDLFLESHSKPYNLDYKINVRLQAISADLEDFGSHLNDMQWTNVAHLDGDGNEVTDNAGRVIIEDNRSDDYEILADSTITDDAMALVTGIAYPYATPYTEGFKNADGSVAVTVSTAQELIDAVNNDDVHSILLTDNIETTDGYLITSNKLIDLGEYTLTRASGSGTLFRASENAKLSIKHGVIDNETGVAFKCIDPNASIELVGVTLTSAGDAFDLPRGDNCTIKIYNSSVTSIDGAGIYIAPNYSNHSLYIQNSSIISNGAEALAGAQADGNTAENINVVVKDSVITGTNRAVILSAGWSMTATGTEFTATGEGVDTNNQIVAIEENHDWQVGDVSITNCIINSACTAYTQRCDSKLTIKDTEINVVPIEPDNEGLGLFIRCGDVTLDNVNLNLSLSDTSEIDERWDLGDYYADDNTLNGNATSGHSIQLVVNSYESLNLKIIGGSYTTYADPNGAPSVFVYDTPASIHNNDGYVYNNTITLLPDADGNMPKFNPDNFELGSYINTTIIKND